MAETFQVPPDATAQRPAIDEPSHKKPEAGQETPANPSVATPVAIPVTYTTAADQIESRSGTVFIKRTYASGSMLYIDIGSPLFARNHDENPFAKDVSKKRAGTTELDRRLDSKLAGGILMRVSPYDKCACILAQEAYFTTKQLHDWGGLRALKERFEKVSSSFKAEVELLWDKLVSSQEYKALDHEGRSSQRRAKCLLKALAIVRGDLGSGAEGQLALSSPGGQQEVARSEGKDKLVPSHASVGARGATSRQPSDRSGEPEASGTFNGQQTVLNDEETSQASTKRRSTEAGVDVPRAIPCKRKAVEEEPKELSGFQRKTQGDSTLHDKGPIKVTKAARRMLVRSYQGKQEQRTIEHEESDTFHGGTQDELTKTEQNGSVARDQVDRVAPFTLDRRQVASACRATTYPPNFIGPKLPEVERLLNLFGVRRHEDQMAEIRARRNAKAVPSSSPSSESNRLERSPGPSPED